MKFLTVIISLSISLRAISQTPLDEYIRQAIANNGSIKEQKEWVEEKKSDLLLAKKNYSPEIGFVGNYTLAAGGRTIAFPVGDLLNETYSTLNQLTKTNKFPQLQNQNVQFLPNNFYDLKARIIQPIIRPEIKINESLKQEQVNLQEIQVDITSRDLTLEIKKAYYQYLQAGKVIEILNQSLVILDEGERVTRSMINNGVGLPSNMLRIQSERGKINTQLFGARNQLRDAKEYFNYLIGRNASDSIIPMIVTELPDPNQYSQDIKNEELSTIDRSLAMQQLAIDLEKKYHAPRLGAQLDIGSQNFNFKWGGYVLGGLQLDIPIWNNHKSDLKQTSIHHAMNAVKEKKEYATQGIHLQLEQAKRGLLTSIDQYHSYTPLQDMNRRYYNDLLKKYKEGQVNPSELIDAQSQITLADLQQNIALYQSWIKAAELERLTKKN